jgi:hypothetical protein
MGFRIEHQLPKQWIAEIWRIPKYTCESAKQTPLHFEGNNNRTSAVITFKKCETITFDYENEDRPK